MKESYIGIMVDDTPELPLGILAILKAGNCFVPINPMLPNDRINFIVDDCKINVLLTDKANYEKGNQIAGGNAQITHHICMGMDNDDVTVEATGEYPVAVESNPRRQETCYVIYTSGSTGRPKGVPITHGNLVPLLFWFLEYFELGRHTRVFQNLSYSFDFGVFELLSTLLARGTLYFIHKHGRGDLTGYVDFINEKKINTIHTTPAFFNGILSAGEKMPGLELVHLGGERLTATAVHKVSRQVSPGCKIYNGYGPTEATINCAVFCIKAEEMETVRGMENIPIGKPSALHSIYILSPYNRLQTIGAAGELCVAGPGLSTGYLNRPELTAEKFSRGAAPSLTTPYPLPLTPFYRTGDLARWLPDGNIEFLGRIDHQVKVRGFRIELGEIENCLSNHKDIIETVVLAKEKTDESKYLCAYIVPRVAHRFTVSELREYLSRTLPDYMIPAYFIQLEKLPVTPNGKIDRKALPEPDEGTIEIGVEYMAPKTGTETKLVNIWQQLLRIKRIGIMDDFFELGGDSILVNQCIARIRGELQAELPMRNFFERPYIKALAEEIEKQERQVSSIKPAARKGEIPLSFAQERLWFLQELDADNVAYFVPRVVRMKGKLDPTLIERTFTEIINRHEILRTVFPTIDGRPVQRIRPPYVFKIPVPDWSRLEKEEQEQKVSGFLSEEDRRPFDFEKGPLLRVTLLKLKDEEHLFVLTEHHLVHDGWTQGVLLNEFIRIFTAYSEGNDHDLPELPIQYADYSIWQRSYLQGERLKQHLDYWQEKLSGLIPVLELPGDRPRPGVMSGQGGLQDFHLSSTLTGRLKEFSLEKGVSLYMTMLAVFKVLIYRYTGEEDLCVGTGIANRGYKEMEGMLGMVINTLPLRTQTGGEVTFIRHLNRVKETCLEAYQHQDTPFGKIVEVLAQERSLSYSPVFQVMFSFMDTPGGDLVLPGLELHLEPTHNRSAKFDINVVVVPPRQQEGDGALAENDREILVEWEYNTDIFDGQTIKRMTGHYTRLLEEALENPGDRISTMSMMGQDEIRRLLVEWNDTGADYPGDKTIHRLFEEQVERTPDRTALVGISDHLSHRAYKTHMTYKQLNEKSGRLAALLIEKGVQPDCIVGIEMERSVEIIIGIMGILKSGGAYLPIDPDYPQDRIDYMLKESGAKIALSKVTADIETVDLNTIPTQPTHPTRLAYVIYTSGSTGRPKGTLVEHRSLVNLCYWHNRHYGVTEEDRAVQYASMGFDASVWEIFPYLIKGVVIHIASAELRIDIKRLAYYYKKNHITIGFLPTQFCRQFMEEISDLPFLRIILTGGDKLDRFVQRPYRLYNNYGPTENTVVTTAFLVESYRDNIPIGKPIANVQVYILSKDGLQLQPIGIPGELCISGAGMSRGYLNHPELTAEKFYRSYRAYKSYKTYSLYKTGDLARQLADGNIEFLGRIDSQVKIRGFRIELGEIENRLLKHPGIKEAVVVVNEEGGTDKSLTAYIVSTRELPESELREYLLEELPDYMIPPYFVPLEKIPLTPNGKVDRRALPRPGLKARESYAAPGDEIERKLAGIWSEVLGRDALHASQLQASIGIGDSFFHLGGHSLNATILAARIEKAFGKKIPLAEIFRNPTIRGLAGYLKDASRGEYKQVELAEKKEYHVLSSAQKRLHFLQQMDKEGTAYNIPAGWVLEGELGIDKLEETVAGLIKRHESLRTSFFIMDEEPVQRIHDEVEFKIDRGFAGSPGGGALLSFVRPFDLSGAPLLRVGLVQLKENRHLFLVDMHHIISDGMSMGVLVQDFSVLYSGKELPGIRLQYKDYAEWQNRERAGQKIAEQGKYWKTEFGGGEIPVLELPVDYARPDMRTFEGNRIDIEIGSEISSALKALALETGTTLYIVLLALYNIFLAKISGQEDIVVGSPVAGRRHADLEKIIGMFVNTLALRNYPVGEKTFADFLGEVKERTLKALENQEYQYEDLLENVGVERDVSRNPLFDVMFVLQNTGSPQIDIPGLTLVPHELEYKTAKFDLLLSGVEAEEKLFFALEYSTQLFKRETVRRFIAYFVNIARGVIGNSGKKISQFEIITQEEKKRILFDFNDTESEYPKDKTIHQLFEEQVERTPAAVALNMSHKTHRAYMTYSELNKESGRLAHMLREKGVKPGTIVGIMLERSIEMIAVVLGILKAGGAYLPIDPGCPQDRVDYMLRDSGAKILLSKMSELSADIETVDLNTIPTLPTHLAYVIYTSGTTGKPKGILIPHRNVVNILHHLETVYPMGERGVYLLKTNYTFDVSVTELFGWFFGGGGLSIMEPGGEKDPHKILNAIEETGVTHVNFVPSMFNAFSAALDPRDIKKLTGLEYIFLAGEPVLPESVRAFRQWNTKTRLENLYGPTEGTIYASRYSLSQWENRGSIPIGKPVDNVQLYICDKNNRLQPIGFPGELCISGDGLAPGYLNNPELTNSKFQITNYNAFLTSAGTPGSYKTGDLTRWLPDGNIEFLGRIDQQVKIRGYRIEPGEIESCLSKHPGIKEAVVLVQEEEDGDKYLCAYIVSDKEHGIPALRDYLSRELPDYMIPSYFVRLEKIPLNPNGKIDRRALPKPEWKAGENYTAPRDEIERELVRIWSEVLGRDACNASLRQTSIGIDDNFFQLGGHSIKATILTAKLHKIFDVVVTLGEIFKMPRIRDLAKHIKGTRKDVHLSIEPTEKKEYYPLSYAQERIYTALQLEVTSTSYNMATILHLAGELDRDRMRDAFKGLIERHESLRTSFAMVENTPVQKVHNKVEFAVEYVNTEGEVTALRNYIRAFDLTRPPLLRIYLAKTGDGEHVMMFDISHLISDGVSLQVLAKELMTLYNKQHLPPLSIQYRDFSGWENQLFRTGKMQGQKDFWLDSFKGRVPVLELPTDFPRPDVRNVDAGDIVNVVLGESLTGELYDIIGETGGTLFTFLLAAYFVLLNKYTGLRDIVVGTVVTGRTHSDLQGLIGVFINMLPLRNYPQPGKSFIDFLEEVKKNTLDAFENQNYPAEELVKELGIRNKPGRHPLFDTEFAVNNIDGEAIEIPGLKMTPHDTGINFAKFDLHFLAVESNDSINVVLRYSTELFRKSTAETILDDYVGIVEQAVEDVEVKLEDINRKVNLLTAQPVILDEEKGDFEL